MADVILNEEVLFHFFFGPDDFEAHPDGSVRIRSGKFRTRRHTLDRHFKLAGPRGFRICSITAGELRDTSGDGALRIDIVSDPIDPPEVDPLLGIPNPSHANVNRVLTNGEAKRVARIASGRVHLAP